MATINSLLFLFSTLAPNVEPPGNNFVPQSPTKGIADFSAYGQNVPVHTRLVCRVGETLSCNSHCQKNCTNYDKDIPCPDICVLKCVCKDPLIRGPDGSCIMPYECPAMPSIPVTAGSEELDNLQCDFGEETSSFPHCQRNCSNLDQVIMCPGEGPRGCVCKSPMIRGPQDTCIMPEQCPNNMLSPKAPGLTQIVCDLAETLSCNSHCQKNCTNYDKEIPCPDICVLGCACIDPFIRSSDGSCVMPYECPATPDTPVNTDTTEEFDDIPCQPDEEASYFSHCQRNCSNIGQIIICPGVGPRGCVCKYPAIRGPEGTCIMPEQCLTIQRSPQDDNDVNPSDMKCPPNEEVSCFSHCQANCTNYDKYISCPMYCVEGCVCTPPMIRGPDSSCILPDQCNALKEDSPMKQCSDSEACDENNDVYSDQGTNSKAFLDLFDIFKFCKDKNEELKVCSSQCPDNCDNYKDNRRACKLICLPLPKCECKDGYVRGPDGNCIEPGQCPSNENIDNICPDNEEYRKCGTACQKNCLNYDQDVPCTAACQSGCFCKEPMIRGHGGKCILKEQCSAFLSLFSFGDVDDCPENEEYKECGTACQKNCLNYDKNIPCEFKCEPECFCKEPMIRGVDGRCIHKEECPEKLNESRQPRKDFKLGFSPDFPKFSCREYEMFSVCAPLCPDDCSNYKEDKLCKHICIPACKCIEGYVKGKDGTCIKKELCDEKKDVCSDLEVYEECGSYCETDCSNYNVTDRKCEDSRCNKGCFCKNGLVRSPDGKCIPPDSCPANSNQVWG